MNTRRFSYGILMAGATAVLLLASPSLAALVAQSSEAVGDSTASGLAAAPTLGSILGTAGALVCLGVLTLAGVMRSRSRTA
jgi:hypothetical protein